MVHGPQIDFLACDLINAAAVAVLQMSAGRSKSTLVVGSSAVVITLY